MQITKNFNLIEFACKDGTEVPSQLIPRIIELAKNLQVLRDELGVSISVNSGYRTPTHNKRIGGVKGSFHVKAMASDLNAKGVKPLKVAKTIKRLIKEGKMKAGGLGLYNTFVHYDTRGYYVKWNKTRNITF